MLSKKDRLKNKSQIFGSYEVIYHDSNDDIEKSRFIMAESEDSALEQFNVLMGEQKFKIINVICPE
tara:strand:+ start:161 stop:358 length:198 start_codon:yes stop_codon:yes gene_type:complete